MAIGSISMLFGLLAFLMPGGQPAHEGGISHEDVRAKIATPLEVYHAGQEIVITVNLFNESLQPLYVLKEDWSGSVWIDRTRRRIVIAHYAITRERENDLRGGWTIGEVYLPEFHQVGPGEQKNLHWKLAKDSNFEPGSWTLEGAISVISDISNLGGLEGRLAAQAIAAQDIVVRCQTRTITILRRENLDRP